MRTVLIEWCNNPATVLRRIVLDPSLNEAPRIRALAEWLEVPVAEGQTAPQAGDLWVGNTPDVGWGDLAGETMWARNAEAEIVVSRLENAKVVATSWVIEFPSGCFVQIFEEGADVEDAGGGPVETAMKFDSKEAAEGFMDRHFIGCAAKDLSVSAPPKVASPVTLGNRIARALDFAVRYGGNDDRRNLRWVIDQMVRSLTGCPMTTKSATDCNLKPYTYEVQGESDEYRTLVAEARTDGDDPEAWDWDTGTPP